MSQSWPGSKIVENSIPDVEKKILDIPPAGCYRSVSAGRIVDGCLKTWVVTCEPRSAVETYFLT